MRPHRQPPLLPHAHARQLRHCRDTEPTHARTAAGAARSHAHLHRCGTMPPVAATSRCTRLLNLQMLYSACSASSTTPCPCTASRSRDRKGTWWVRGGLCVFCVGEGVLHVRLCVRAGCAGCARCGMPWTKALPAASRCPASSAQYAHKNTHTHAHAHTHIHTHTHTPAGRWRRRP
jgi:hypothetical protein